MKTRTYTREEIRLVKKRAREFRQGKCFCFTLIEAWGKKRITEEEYRAVKNFDIPCPLHVSGECKICKNKINAGGIDLYEATRCIDVKYRQMDLFPEFKGDEIKYEVSPMESLWNR